MRHLFFEKTLLALLTLILVTSCSKGKLDSDSDSQYANKQNIKVEESISFKLSEKESLNILSSKEAKELIEIQNQFLDKIKGAIARGYSIDYLKKISGNAINKNEQTEILKVVFGTEKEGFAFIQNIQRARLNFIQKNKFISENKAEMICTSCNKLTPKSSDLFFRNLNVYDKSRLKIPSNNNSVKKLSMYVEEVEGDTPVCGSYWQQVKLLGCMALCSAATAGWGAVLCGWACWCMLCPESVTGDIIC
jgi:hypothetical protein